MKDYKDAWVELKSRLENFHWNLQQDPNDKRRASDIEHVLRKMDDFEERIR